MSLDLSVVIPTCNRRDRVCRLLAALQRDDAGALFEVIVVDDGSRDDTVARLTALVTSYPMRVLSQSAAGPAEARNAGARAARGRILLFLDDDVEPLPGTLASHRAFHAAHANTVGIGDLPPVVADQSLVGTTLRGWWDRMLHDARRPGHRFGFRNVLTGHLSVPREQFSWLGGFDTAFRCHEDWEFGYRALQAGMHIRFVEGAVALHHESSDLPKIVKRKFDEGVADVQLARRHPELAGALPFAWPITSRKSRVIRRLAWQRGAESLVVSALDAVMHAAARARMRGRWRAGLDLLLTYWYWRGVATMVPDRNDLAALTARPDAASVDVTLDLAEGIANAERRLDELSPASATLLFRGWQVATIPATPGTEPLRGEHLRAMLALPYYRWSLGEALRKAGAVPDFMMPVPTDLADSRGTMADMNAPVVRDEQLSAELLANDDMEHGSAIPPSHRVA